MTFKELILLSLQPAITKFNNWRLACVERHCLICADFEKKQASNSWKNASYYQLKAAQARAEMK